MDLISRRVLVPLGTLLVAFAPAAQAALVINEVQTAGTESAADEFVEIANTSSTPVDLSGMRLVYRSATSETDTLLVRFEDGASIPAGGVLVAGGSGFTGPRDVSFTASLAGTGGGVALRDTGDAFVDRVAWGTVDNGFVETRATLAPAAGHSIHRIPCGYDTDYNARDLQEIVTPSPRVQCDGARAPAVLSVSFAPPGVEPGQASSLRAAVSVGTRPVASVTADLTALGGSQTAPLTLAAGVWTVAVSVPQGAEPGPVPVRVRAEDIAGATGLGQGSLYIQNPVPAAVVVNEVQVAGSSADTEFVELYNRSGADADISGWKLAYRGPTSASDTTLHEFGSVILKPGGHYLLGTASFKGPKDAAMKTGLGASGGGVGLRDALGNLVDSVGYGSAANLFVETTAAPAPDSGESIERSTPGRDTNDNAADFKVRATPSPTPAVNKPVVTAVSFIPASAAPLATVRIYASVAPGDAEVTDVAADLIFVGGDTNHPLAKASGNTWTAEFTVGPLITVGSKPIDVFARDALGLVAVGSGYLTVTNAKPVALVKVNEVQTGTAASAYEEFVELYNTSSSPADLEGWTLVYRPEKGLSDLVLARFTNQAIAPNGYFLLGSEVYSGPKNGSLLGALASAAGSVGLRDPSGALVDSVGYGTAANALVETAPAPAPDPGRSIGRKTAGQDTDNNGADFRVETPPSPQVGTMAVPGDANGDGTCNMADAAFALALWAGLAPAAGTGADLWPAAPDARITMEDVLAIARLAAD